MSGDLERRLRAARPVLAEPEAAATARARAAALEGRRLRGVRPSRWAGGRAARLLMLAGLVIGAGGAVAATLLNNGSAASAAPATRWRATETVSGRFSGFETPATAVSGQGDVLVAWSGSGRVEARLRPPGGAWDPIVPLSAPGAVATAPAAAMDGRGGALVVWRERKGGSRVALPLRFPSGATSTVLRTAVGQRVVVVARARPAGGAWGPAVELSARSANRSDGADPQVAIARDGTAVAAWPYGRTIQVRTRSASGRWSAVQSLDAQGAPSHLHLALDPSGAAALVWVSTHQHSRALGPTPNRVADVRVALRPAGGGWQPSADVSGPLPYEIPNPRIAVAGNLRAVAVWNRMAPPGPDMSFSSNAEVAVHAPGGGWSAPRPVDPHPPVPPPRTGYENTGVPGIDADGTVVVLVSRGQRVAFTTMSPGGAWSPLRDLTSARPASWVLLAPDGRGLTTVLGTLRGLLIRRFEPGTGWEPGRVVSTRDHFSVGAAFAAAPRGTAVLAWLHFMSGSVVRPMVIRAAVREPDPRAGAAPEGRP